MLLSFSLLNVHCVLPITSNVVESQMFEHKTFYSISYAVLDYHTITLSSCNRITVKSREIGSKIKDFEFFPFFMILNRMASQTMKNRIGNKNTLVVCHRVEKFGEK